MKTKIQVTKTEIQPIYTDDIIRRMVTAKDETEAIKKANNKMVKDGFNLNVWKQTSFILLPDNKTYLVKYQGVKL